MGGSRTRLLLLLALTSCGAPPLAARPGEPHLGDDWFAWRASTLGLSIAAARARDAALPENEAPASNPELRAEGAALWASLCAGCHGASGRLEGVPLGAEPNPRRWGGLGASMGFFFGGDAMRAGLYRKIRDGGVRMPAWGELLAREQSWALVAHLESL